ncbi:ATP-binding cassette domain-containing protein [Arthrobacter sp. PsM3]|uniref:ATP-binding cassette domain-containing protein n=1 Tax=Arthrobacter sp. PsM3 TaxID=3030531 RepID=UPI00263B8945|nr:ATP-binding cassette domain-containing protein [Arthrobacter sp. PsM3]MDN4644982.1 ATP-binding cassette domain-containing protein [Arthrobacter sp. PsM3]
MSDYLPPAPDGTLLRVRMDGREWSFPPVRTIGVGRDPRADVTLDDERVSREHLRVWHSDGGWWVADEASLNGTWVVGADAAIDGPVQLHPDGLRLRLGALDGPELFLSAETSPQPATPRVLTIGRARSCDVVVDDPLASRRHAAIEIGEHAVLRDSGSFNGTFLNGERVHGATALHCGDLIGLGSSTLTWDGAEVVMPPPQRPVFSARHLEVTTKSGAHLMDDVSITVPAGTLVAVIGPSGAGKSTLLGALTGLRPATRGRVSWNGRDLYAEYAQLRFLVGLVPQEDILHRQLTVRRALQFAAQLRLPPDTGAAERDERVDQVLAEVDLSNQIDQRIDSLSGGQRKRTSIALELLTAPQLLFLDEPTSGLDPGLDKQVMASLRALADAGRVVLVVTHSVLALDECDRVLVLARGGRVAYFGPPADVLAFFGVDDYPAAFAALEDQTWVGRYAGSPAREAYVGRTTSVRSPVPAADAPPPPRAAPVRQLGTLIRRSLAVVAADRLFVVLLVGMPVLLALMAHAFPGAAGLSVSDAQGDLLQVQQRLIVLVVGAALMGTALAIRELVVERPIYVRERAVGLSPGAYLLSKALVLGGLVACQCVLFTMLALLGLPGPDDALVLGNGLVEVAAAVAAVGITMAVAALVVSAAATSTEQTMPALVALVMGQLVLCGGLFQIAGRGGLEQLSWLLPARFGYAATAATVGLQQPPAPTVDALYDPTAEQWLADLGLLGLQSLAFFALAAWALHRSVTRNPWR